ncbi:MAG: peptidase [Fibrobacterota bacterium]
MIFIFIDGFGKAGSSISDNPVKKNEFPILYNIINMKSKAIDPVMGVPGLPQSATGQTSLFCGVNAQKLLGRHIEGFPTRLLKDIVKNDNIFKKLENIKKTATFANGYWLSDINNLSRRQKRMISVTTVMAMSGTGEIRTMDKMLNEEAVYQDITQEILVARGASLPIITPEAAAERLSRIAHAYDFTLFEYFQTDIAAHKQEPTRIRKVLSDLERFLSRIHALNDFRRRALVITSDHGNIEDLSTPLHTMNPVPFYVKGPGSRDLLRKVNDLSDVTPSVVKWFSLK